MPALVLLVALCSPGARADSAPSLRVFASVLPVQYFVQRVGGDDVQVDVMVLPGQSPATYEPRPQQVAALAQADLYVRVGVPFEDAWMRRISAANPDMEVLDLREGLPLRPMEAHAHDDAHGAHEHGNTGQHGELDAHVWTSPRLVREMIVRIRERLSALDPAHADAYLARQQTFDRELQALDEELTARLRGIAQRSFMVYHPAWGYFADAYGLRQIPVEFEGKEPGAKRLAVVIEQARASDIHVVVVQPQFDQRAARRVAQAIDGRVASVDPLSVDYAESLRALAQVIAGPSADAAASKPSQ
ncbi:MULTISPECIES: metal ABC transporter solute-binding protein, Zn/Mn family [Thiorhodovibrio]|uniref:metal ABC transporter solute-binding protein, Zn/Mn family n=1 Tax=Thiorhodovibrio TaxID=61593 RepID=UPI002B258D68|nr:zinc ABC transporter substrate-binding protein [Thiorhodovibrio litoralis]